MSKDFKKISYERHKTHFQEEFDEKKLAGWKRKDTVDYWRHLKYFKNLNPIIEKFPNSSWLTVGDGRYGVDANYIYEKGIKNVVATDISEAYLKVALEDGFIPSYKIENAEKMSFDDNAFDFVFCKDAYHHFPRPMIALYEMLRVAKKAVILIEPNDEHVFTLIKGKQLRLFRYSLKLLFKSIKKLFRQETIYNSGGYEPVGNYIYSISEREIEKVALGLNYEVVSFKGMNDMYIQGAEHEEMSDDSELFLEIKKGIEKADRQTKSGYSHAGGLFAIIQKKSLGDDILRELENLSFENRILTRNPYI